MDAFKILNDNCWGGVLGWVPPESLHTCRLVCSTWRRVIDHQLNHEPENRADYDSKYWQDLTTTESLQAFLKKSRRNASREQPFLERGTRLLFDAQDGIGDADVEWKNSVLFQILDKFGGELWWVTLEEDMEVPPITYYQHLRKLLRKLPNLKGVTFDCALLRRKPWPTEDPELTRFMEVFPLPKLPYLESCRGYVPQPVLDKYGPQLNYLKLEQPEDLTPATAHRLTSLRELKLNHVFPDTPLDHFWHLTTTPIEKLSIRLENRQSADDLGLWPIDQFLENLRDLKTLKTLDITTCGPYIGECFPIPEDLKNNWVQNLTIRIRNGDKRNVFYNFLGCFTNLQFFSLRFEELHPDELEPCEHPLGFEEMIWVRPFLSPTGELTDDFYQSNIWTKIPTLNWIEIVYGSNNRRYREYTRSQRKVYLNLI